MTPVATARGILLGWLRRYAHAALIIAGVAVVVGVMPSTIPIVHQTATPPPYIPAAQPLTGNVAATPATSPLSTIVAPLLASGQRAASAAGPPTTPTPAATPPTLGAPPPSTPAPPSPPTTPVTTCPISLPSPAPSSSANPVLLDFLPLAGPFGPEALAFLPVVGPLLPAITPLLPALDPTLQGVQPEIAQAVNGAVLVEQAITGPFGPQITAFTPQALSGEKEVIAVLQPITTGLASSPPVECVYELASAAGALLVRGG